MIGLGIDTGGTCTDSVLFDTISQTVLATGKALTTKKNLIEGMEQAIAQLPEEQVKSAQFVSLSTTLATNACVENRGGKVKLVMIGKIPEDPARICQKYGFEDASDLYFLAGIPGGGNCQEVIPDWDKFTKDLEEFTTCDAVGIVQFYPEWNGGAFEEKAAEIVREELRIPVICGSQLFSDTNAYQRGAGTYLNARLILIIHEFLGAVREVLKKKQLDVPIYVMRSDGSLMNEEFAKNHPVETLLCGPAASTMGGIFGSSSRQALVVDMGGTTTDVAIIKDRIPVTITDGVKIGGWKTFVKGLYIDTFGLGGDTCVRYREGKLVLENFRVIPVSYIATKTMDLPRRILEVTKRNLTNTQFYYEGFELQKGMFENHAYSEKEQRICQMLEEGPLLVHEIAEKLRCQVRSIPVERLEQEGAIMRFGLTPTDIMHIKGDYTPYDTEAAKAAVQCFAKFSGKNPSEVPDEIYEAVKQKLHWNLVRVFLSYGVEQYKDGIPDDVIQWLTYSVANQEDPQLSCLFQTEYDLIGVGAPTDVFLEDVAKRMHTRCIRHPNAKTANALGTLVGQVSVKRSLTITFQEMGFRIYVNGESLFFEKMEDAEECAVNHLQERTKELAKERGVKGEVKFYKQTHKKEFSVYGAEQIMELEVEVIAYGNILS